MFNCNYLYTTLLLLIFYQFFPAYGINAGNMADNGIFTAYSSDTIYVPEAKDDKTDTVVPDKELAPPFALLLSEYLSIESVTGNEREAGMFLAQTCKDMGLHVEVFTNDIDTFNFAASLYPLEMNKPNVILLNHIDVVPAENPELWTHPPFSGAIEDGYIWGRGAIDMKGMAIMQLMAMNNFIEKSKEHDFPYNITMLSVSGEETGGFTGAKVVKERYLDKLNPLVVYGEGGTGLPGVLSEEFDRKLFGISVATKRVLWLKLTLKMNTSGHGSVPPRSYAVQEMINALDRVIWHNNNRSAKFSKTTYSMFRELGKLESGILGIALRNIRLLKPLAIPILKSDEIMHSLFSNTITITGINTPVEPPNQISQEVISILDCRLLPDVDTDEFIKHLKFYLKNNDIEIEVIQYGKTASPTKPDEHYYKLSDALKEVYKTAEVIPILFPASNDNTYFRAKGIPAYGLLPVFMSLELLETIHSIDERLPVKRLEEGINVYTELIRLYLASS